MIFFWEGSWNVFWSSDLFNLKNIFNHKIIYDLIFVKIRFIVLINVLYWSLKLNVQWRSFIPKDLLRKLKIGKWWMLIHFNFFWEFHTVSLLNIFWKAFRLKMFNKVNSLELYLYRFWTVMTTMKCNAFLVMLISFCVDFSIDLNTRSRPVSLSRKILISNGNFT